MRARLAVAIALGLTTLAAGVATATNQDAGAAPARVALYAYPMDDVQLGLSLVPPDLVGDVPMREYSAPIASTDDYPFAYRSSLWPAVGGAWQEISQSSREYYGSSGVVRVSNDVVEATMFLSWPALKEPVLNKVESRLVAHRLGDPSEVELLAVGSRTFGVGSVPEPDEQVPTKLVVSMPVQEATWDLQDSNLVWEVRALTPEGNPLPAPLWPRFHAGPQHVPQLWFRMHEPIGVAVHTSPGHDDSYVHVRAVATPVLHPGDIDEASWNATVTHPPSRSTYALQLIALELPANDPGSADATRPVAEWTSTWRANITVRAAQESGAIFQVAVTNAQGSYLATDRAGPPQREVVDREVLPGTAWVLGVLALAAVAWVQRPNEKSGP